MSPCGRLDLGLPDRDGFKLIAALLGGRRQIVAIGYVSIDLLRPSVRKAGHEVHLTPKEYAVLAELAKHPGRVLTHSHLLRSAWGPAQEGQTEYLGVVMRGLRQKLEAQPSIPVWLINEPGIGYRLRAEAEQEWPTGECATSLGKRGTVPLFQPSISTQVGA